MHPWARKSALLRVAKLTGCGLLLLAMLACVPPFSQKDPLQFEEGVTEFSVGGVRYVSAGNPEKPLVFFLHGTPGSWHAFKHLIDDPELQQIAHLVAIDRPGFGASADIGIAASFASQVQYLGPALKLNRSKKPSIVVGHSLGGSIAYRFAIDASDNVGGIIVISSNVSPDLGQPRWFNTLAGLPVLKSLLPAQLRLANEEIAPLQGELQDIERNLDKIHGLVTVIHGSDDALVSIDNLVYVESRLQNAQSLHILREEGTGHSLIWDKPQLVRQAIIEQARVIEAAE